MVFPLKAKAYIGSDSAPTAHISIATAWHTAYDVRNFQTTRHKCYFVQDYEPWFFPAGSLATFAEETYRFGFTGITAGTWLADMLHRDFGMTTHAVSFSYDRELYRVLPRKNPETKNIFFYARPNTARRSFELGVLVLAEVAKRHPDAIAVLAGADLSGYEIPFKHTNPGIVDLADLPALYAQCDVGLVLSFSICRCCRSSSWLAAFPWSATARLVPSGCSLTKSPCLNVLPSWPWPMRSALSWRIHRKHNACAQQD